MPLDPKHLPAYIKYFTVLRNIAMRLEQPKWRLIKAIRLSIKQCLLDQIS